MRSISPLCLALPTVVAALAGCGSCGGGPPDDIADCADAECRQAWLLANWETKPQRVIDEVTRLTEPAEQVVVVQALAEAHPGETSRICEVLDAGPALERCKILNARPHLWQIDVDRPDDGDKGAGKVFPTLVPTEEQVNPWKDSEPLAAPCPDGGATNACQSEAAWAAAQEGRTLDAARHCMGIEDGQWRYECFFQASERSFEPGKRGRLDDALRLCLGADIYQTRCLGHLSSGLAGQAPAAGAPDRTPWEALNRYATEARRGLANYDPGLSERFTADMWARAFGVAYSNADPVSGNPLDVVEPHAIPHVRAAAAWRLLALEGEEDRTAAEWRARLAEVLAARTTGAQAEPEDLGDIKVGVRWQVNLPGEDALPWVPYISGMRRAIATDPDADALVCILEAAARDGRQHGRLFSTALDHDDSVVRWTAARLLSTQGPSTRLLERIKADPDPLVRARGG